MARGEWCYGARHAGCVCQIFVMEIVGYQPHRELPRRSERSWEIHTIGQEIQRIGLALM